MVPFGLSRSPFGLSSSKPGGLRATLRQAQGERVLPFGLSLSKAWWLGSVLAMCGGVALADPGLAVGRQLYRGELALPGTISGHAQPLPPMATRCTNCHSRDSAAQAASGAASFAPLLTRERLLGPIARRGGPPSRYDEASFCRLLRSGIDPAIMLIPRQMPRYAIDDTQCKALWTYLLDAGETR